MRILIGISGASGAIYGVRLLELLKELGVETHLIVSTAGQLTLKYETSFTLKDIQEKSDYYYNQADIGAACASGSFVCDGMIIAPCSMRTLAEIATGMTSALLTRAGDVCLKERRRLIMLTRETPLTLAHIENMAQITRMGGIIAPPVPAFYAAPETIDDMINHTLGRILDLFGLESDKTHRWRA